MTEVYDSSRSYTSLLALIFLVGLAAPAIAEGLGVLAPTLGGLIPAIGASGFAAAASATGSVAGSAAVAASFGGHLLFFFFICWIKHQTSTK